MMMVDDGGGRGVKNGRKSDDIINGRPRIVLPVRASVHFEIWPEHSETGNVGMCNQDFAFHMRCVLQFQNHNLLFLA